MRCFRYCEPSLQELMTDDLLGLVLAAQNLHRDDFARMMKEAAERLAHVHRNGSVASARNPRGRW